MTDFIPAFLHAFGDGIRGILTAPDQTAAQFADRRWQDENRQRVGPKGRIADLLCALPVDVKQYIPPDIDRLLHPGFWRAVEVAKHMRMFQHFTSTDHFAKLRF